MCQAQASYMGMKWNLTHTFIYSCYKIKKFKKKPTQIYYMLGSQGLNIYTECNKWPWNTTGFSTHPNFHL